MRYLIVLVLLAGCATPEERAERLISRYGPLCEKLGFQPDTDPWRQCLMQQQADRRAATASRVRTNCTMIGNTMTCN